MLGRCHVVVRYLIGSSGELFNFVTKLNTPTPITTLMAFQGAYKAVGHTINSSDGNKTDLSNLVIHFQNGKLAGTGYYDGGSEYNEAKSTR